MKLRNYQQDAYDKTMEEFKTHQAVLGVMCTGGGKTIIMSHIAKDFLSRGRIMGIAHREELITQGRDKMESVTGIRGDIEMGSNYAHRGYFKSEIVWSSVQTHNAGKEYLRMMDFDPMEFSLLLIDEAHHAVSDSYVSLIDHYKKNPNIKIFGVTATPDRTDEEALGKIFTSCAFEYDIRDGINDGWLCPITQQMVYVKELDLSNVKTTAGDLNGKQLNEILEFEENLHAIAHPTVELTGSKKTLVFAASVAQAERLAEIINRHKPDSARFVCGATPKDIRRRMFSEYAEKKFQYLLNVGVACLDNQTEILTTDGWVGHEDINYKHRIANWKDGDIFFNEPLAIEIRDRRPDEKMAFLETKNRSIRVTDDHRMLYRTLQKGRFKVCRAKRLVNRAAELPICGYAEPLEVFIQDKPEMNLKRRISANSYNYRRQGYSEEDSKTLATARIIQRSKLKYKQPEDLTVDECKFIGFWLGDGTKQKLQTGGVEYLVWQAETYPNICRWIDDVLLDIGVDSVKRIVKPRRPGGTRVCEWSMPRGTGFGNQKRNGLYHLEPYLDKNGSPLLWGLCQEQFDAIIEGFWRADGEHYDLENVPDNLRICNTNKKLLDLLQAIAVCRCYRANITDGITNTKKGHKPLWRLSLTPRGKLGSHAMTKFRLQFEDGWKQEKVWCVKSDTGFIVTRRRGTVTVTGNTEGFDDPDIECVVMARPTKSRCLYTQMCLDCDTEILTNYGWMGISNEFTPGEKIAAFDMQTNSIKWETATDRVSRKLQSIEYMCSISNPHLDIRTSNLHDFVIRSRTGRPRRRTEWRKTEAEKLLSIPDFVEIPVAAIQDAPGVQLTDDEIRFVGLFMTDGNYNPHNNVVTLYQSERYPECIEYIERLLKGCGFKYGHLVDKSAFTNFGPRLHPVHRFYVSKGKPRGIGKDKTGWSKLEPYIDKDMSPLFENANRDQLLVLLEAMNVGDGKKHKKSLYKPKTISICTNRLNMADKLQSLCVRRGMRCNLGVAGTKGAGMVMLNISPERSTWTIKSKSSDNRPVFVAENRTGDEPVWCVTVPSGAIVTRRNGKVAILGNCGRGTRPASILAKTLNDMTDADARKAAIAASFKPCCEIIDFVGNSGRHKLIHAADVLGGKFSDEVVERAVKNSEKSGKPGDVMTELQKAEQEIKKEYSQKSDAARRERIRILAQYSTAKINPFDVLGVEPVREMAWHKGRPASQKQIDALTRFGIDPAGPVNGYLSFVHASQLLDRMINRAKEHKCTFKQANVLRRYGYDTDSMSFDEARSAMDTLARNGWKRPKKMA